MSKPKIKLIVIGPDPGRKQAHLILLKHHGGGWWRGQCMGQAKRCKAGVCPHISGLGIKGKSGKVRPVRAMPRELS